MHTGIHHLAFEYATIDDLLTAYTRLKDLGIKPHMSLDHGMTLSFYYVDPDGNSVELQVDNFGDWGQSQEWMRTSPNFAADPIGKFVDTQLPDTSAFFSRFSRKDEEKGMSMQEWKLLKSFYWGKG